MTEPVPAGQPPAKAPQPLAPQTPRERVAGLRAQLAEAEAALPLEPGTVRLKVMPPHSSFTAGGGFTVSKDPTLVPVSAVTRLLSAAADAGVTIKEA